jgi:tetratricopeptide (TPR) repeat protein
MALGTCLPALGAVPNEQMLGQQAMAEAFADAGVRSVAGKQTNDASVRQSAALLRAACNECNFEPRFPRLLVEACLQLKDEDGAISALERYRAINEPAVQNDQFAQVELIDLFTHKQQTLETKLSYLQQLLNAKLPDPVKSHVAWVCSGLFSQKFDSADAAKMLDLALQLNPVSPEALQSQYVAAQAGGSAPKRAEALVGLLKSNPSQPAVMGSLADALEQAGQPDQAVVWYRRSFALSQQVGLGVDPARYLNCAVALYQMEQFKDAADAGKTLVKDQPTNVNAATLVLLATRAAARPAPGQPPADADQVQKAQDALLKALSSQMNAYHTSLNGKPGDAAAQPQAPAQPSADASGQSPPQPSASEMLSDVPADVAKVHDIKNRPGLTPQVSNSCDNYTATLADLVFYYAYLDPQPAVANKLLDSLRLLRPADDAELTRLEGFAFLADGKRDEAQQKFSAIASHDPLANLGLLILRNGDASVAADGSKLLTDHPAGMLSALLLDGLHDTGAKPAPTPDAKAVSAAADGFPVRLLDLLDRAHTPEFYNLIANPRRVSGGFDEPALVDVSIKNISDYDLSIGQDGAIRSDLWFDVAVQGGSNPTFSGTAYDRIAGPLVLKAHQFDKTGTDQIVRVDAGPLAQFLEDRPTIDISMLFSVLTNPIGQAAGVAPGPGGYRNQFSSPMERLPSPINTPAEVQAVISPLQNGRIDQKIHTLELLTAYVSVLRGKVDNAQKAAQAAAPAGVAAPAGDGGVGELPPPTGLAPAPSGAPQANIQDMQQKTFTFLAAIRSAERDPSPLVQYFAQTKLAELSSPADRAAAAKAMVKGTDWEQRLLGLILANDLHPDQCRPLAEALKGDSTPWVQDFAAATLDLLDHPAPPAAPAH